MSEEEVLPNADHRVETTSDRRIAIPAGERQYHIGLGPGDLAEYILLPGDQDRTTKIAARFDDVEMARSPSSISGWSAPHDPTRMKVGRSVIARISATTISTLSVPMPVETTDIRWPRKSPVAEANSRF